MTDSKFKVGWIYENECGTLFQIISENDNENTRYPILAKRVELFEYFSRKGKYWSGIESDKDLILETGKMPKENIESLE